MQTRALFASLGVISHPPPLILLGLRNVNCLIKYFGQRDLHWVCMSPLIKLLHSTTSLIYSNLAKYSLNILFEPAVVHVELVDAELAEAFSHGANLIEILWRICAYVLLLAASPTCIGKKCYKDINKYQA